MQNLLLWGNTSVVRDFCSLSPISCTFFSQLLPCHGEQQRKMTIVCIFTWMQWITDQKCTKMKQYPHFLLCSSHFSLDNIAPCRICYDCQKLVFWLWDCFCLLYLPLHYPNLRHSYHRLCWKRNKYFVLDDLLVSTFIYQSMRANSIH